MYRVTDDEHEHHAFGIPLPAQMVEAIVSDHHAARGHAEDRYNAGMRWLDGLDVDGLMALRWVLSCDPDDAYGNNRFYDGIAVQRLRSLGVDPRTGIDPTVALLQDAAVTEAEPDDAGTASPS